MVFHLERDNKVTDYRKIPHPQSLPPEYKQALNNNEQDYQNKMCTSL